MRWLHTTDRTEPSKRTGRHRPPCRQEVQAGCLGIVFGFAILTQWVAARWPVTIFQIAICALAAVEVVRARRIPPRPGWPFAVLGSAVVWGLVQLLTGHTVYRFQTMEATAGWAVVLAVFFVGTRSFRTPGSLEWFRMAALWFGSGLAVIAILQSYTSGGRIFWVFPSGYQDYVMGPFLNRNHYAAFVETILPLALYEALRSPRRSLLYGAMAAILYASVVASASRAGAVLATVELFAVPLVMTRRGLPDGVRVRSALAPAAVLIVVLSAVVGPQALGRRFLDSDPYAGRRELALSTIQMANQHRWFGTGLGTWATAYPGYALADFGAAAHQAHSDWLEWAAEGGIPFGLLMLSLFVWAVRPAVRSVWGLGVLAVALHATVDYPLSRPFLVAWVILLLSALAVTKDH